MHFKDLTNFIQQLMNWPISNLTDRKQTQKTYKVKRFYRQKAVGMSKLYWEKTYRLLQGYFPYRGQEKISGRLSNNADQILQA